MLRDHGKKLVHHKLAAEQQGVPRVAVRLADLQQGQGRVSVVCDANTGKVTFSQSKQNIY